VLRALELGGLSLFWLDGGGFRLDGGSLFGPVPRPRWSAVCPPADDNSLPMTAHVVLVQDGSTWGLIDSGFGHHLSERQRGFYSLERDSQLHEGLASLGLSPTQVDWVVLTHLHLDHAGGVLGRDGHGQVAPVFANAPIWVQALEAREARDPSNRAHGVYTGDAFDRLEALDLVREVDGQAELSPRVRLFLTGGHSRGHQGVLLEGSGAAAAVCLGDLLVTHAHLPVAWVSALDDFPLDTIRAKREWLARAAERDWWVAFSHDPRYVAGRLGPDGRLLQARSPAGEVCAVS
jgi:glyoxylase-like metal-dependent hydrolase (beta-lactamase superfamily II)